MSSPFLLSEAYFGTGGLLSESSMAEIKQLGEELSHDFDPQNYDDILAAFNLVYEIEYKYNMLLNKKFRGLEQRKYNILEILEDASDNIINEVAKTFEVVFREWLESHALLSPRAWAEKRVEVTEAGGDELDSVWGGIIGEYERYRFGFGRHEQDKIVSNIMMDSRHNLDKMPRLKRMILNYADDELNMMYDELESEGFEEFGEMRGEEFKSKEEARDFIDNYGFDAKDSFVWEDFETFKNLVIRSEEILTELYEHIVFPLWYGHWKEQGIDKTRETIENAYELIKKMRTLPANKKFGALNHIINVNHQTGSMMEYYGERYGVGGEFFEELSKRDTSDWDDELREIGVQV